MTRVVFPTVLVKCPVTLGALVSGRGLLANVAIDKLDIWQ